MAIEMATVKGNFVFRDDVNTWRWYDAIGPNVVKWLEDAVTFNVGDTGANPTAYVTTEVGTNTVAPVAGAPGGRVVITTGATENNGLEMQLLGEAFKLSSGHQCYFGARFAGNDVDQSDFLLGLAITDTTCIAGCTDGLYFRSVDESGVLNFILEKNSVETSNAAATMTDGAYVTAEWFWDGTNVTAYINGVQVAQVATTDASFPNDEYMTPTIGILTGENSANTLTFEWARCIQVQI